MSPWRLVGILAAVVVTCCYVGSVAPGLVPCVLFLALPWILRDYRVVTDRQHRFRFETAHDLLAWWHRD